jgi:putative acetyltransferase
MAQTWSGVGEAGARRVDPGDEDAVDLVAHMVAYLDDLYPDFDPCSAQLDLDDFREPSGGWVLIDRDERAAACGGVRACDGIAGVAELKRIWVEPAARGHRLARRLLVECEQLARDLGYEEVYLDTGPLQVEAMRLYETSGYRLIPNYGRNARNPFFTSYAKRLL